jgi:hypothetical protein
MWLGFQIVEKSGGNQSQNTTMGEFSLVGWLFIQLVSSNGNIATGRTVRKIFAQPLRKPPFDQSQLQETQIKLDYAVYDFQYSENDVLEWRAKKMF